MNRVPSEHVCTAIRAHHGADMALHSYAQTERPEELDAACAAARRVLIELRAERKRIRTTTEPAREHA